MTPHHSRIEDAKKALENFCSHIDKWRIHDDLLLGGKSLPSLYISHDSANRIQDAIRVVVGANRALIELVPSKEIRRRAAALKKHKAGPV